MLKCRIISSDLKLYDQAIEKYLPREQPDWNPQISEAFELLKDKIRARGVPVRLLGIPLDLNRLPTETAKQNTLTSFTKTANFSGKHIVGIDGFRRFVVNVTAISAASGFTFQLQGSNDQDITNETEPSNWSLVSTLTPTATGETSIVLADEYKYYRLNLTVPGSGSPSVTFTASLVETYFDRWIIYEALALIYAMLSKETGDVWTEKSKSAMIAFDLAFDSYKFSEDLNDDNLLDSTEQNESGQISFSR